MGRCQLPAALKLLQRRFSELDWTYHDIPGSRGNEKMYRWPGGPDEAILVCVHKSGGAQELFHRHDFFYFNYTYKGQYDSLSYRHDNRITIREGELYAGQPLAGHALCVHDNQETIIIGVLIRKETFFRSFLPMLSANSRLFRFFLDPTAKSFSDEFIHFKIEDDNTIRPLLEMAVTEYAYKQEDTQEVLKPLVLSFLMQVARQYTLANRTHKPEALSDRIVQYVGERFDTVTLREISRRFNYHPNYISTLLTRETGKSFSRILLEQRMERAVILLKGTPLPVEEIALMLGYSNSSNFYKAFREYYRMSPRKYIDLD
ncbi:helix-turn-helix transcriptional regulator [Breznakiella homolactica]|uniref:Helix-turn-helix transcriptional regulator n=1 Tax=Breznakiella homolactica TaxID=2798577 RepID=A0A7T8B9X0_9SPIR|nr:helix-turn-helix transcriptional regulator [Breznakiella homolactica]QQO07623.1 helix-turn-helix transcriptional regulator [Breznakiella homolactica]